MPYEPCPEKPAGAFRVSFTYIETDGTVRDAPMTIPIGPHALAETPEGSNAVIRSGAWVTTGDPYEGSLCPHEVEWLSYLPGKTYNAHWRFDVQPLKPAATRGV